MCQGPARAACAPDARWREAASGSATAGRTPSRRGGRRGRGTGAPRCRVAAEAVVLQGLLRITADLAAATQWITAASTRAGAELPAYVMDRLQISRLVERSAAELEVTEQASQAHEHGPIPTTKRAGPPSESARTLVQRGHVSGRGIPFDRRPPQRPGGGGGGFEGPREAPPRMSREPAERRFSAGDRVFCLPYGDGEVRASRIEDGRELLQVAFPDLGELTIDPAVSLVRKLEVDIIARYLERMMGPS